MICILEQILKLGSLSIFLLVPSLLYPQIERLNLVEELLREKWHLSGIDANEIPIQVPIISRSAGDYHFTDNENLNRSEGEPFIAINPTDSNHIVVSFMDLGFELDFPVFYSRDGGESWERSQLSVIDTFKTDFPDLILAGGGDPIFAFDASGRLYFSWIYLGIQFTTGTIVTYWAWSDDSGVNFQLAKGNNRFIEYGKINLITAEIQNTWNGIFDRPWFAVDRSGGIHDGTLYCAGLFLPSDSSQIEGKGIVLRMKRPGVDSFELHQTQISVSEEAQFANVAVDRVGRIHISYVDLDTSMLMHALVEPGGTDLLSLDTVASVTGFTTRKVHARENPAPSLIVHPANFKTYLSWSDFSDELVVGKFSFSKNSGGIWAPFTNLNETLVGGFAQVLMPVLAINETGELVLTWYGLDEADQGFYYVSHSANEGNTWSVPLQISGDTTDFSIYNDAPFFGDYYTTTYSGKTAYIVWSDGRNEAGAKVYFAKLNPTNPNVGIHPFTEIQSHTKVGQVYPSPGQGEAFIEIETKRSQRTMFYIFTSNGKLIGKWDKWLFQGYNKVQIENIDTNGSFLLLIKSNHFEISRKFMRN